MCKECGKIAPLNEFGRRRECRECRAEDFISKAEELHVDEKGEPLYKYDKVRDQYITTATKVEVFCKIHKEYFMQRPNSHTQGMGCPECAVKRITKFQTKSQKQYDLEIKEVHNGEIIRIDPYVNTAPKIKHKHLICGHKWEVRPNGVLKGMGCPKCNKPGKTEISLFENLSKHFSYLKTESRIYPDFLKGLEYDIFFPQINLALEVDGIQHFKPIKIWGGKRTFESMKIRDKQKNKLSIENNITLIRIKTREVKEVYDELVDLIENYIDDLLRGKIKEVGIIDL